MIADARGEDSSPEETDPDLVRATTESPVRWRTVLLSMVAVLAAAGLFVTGWLIGRPGYPGERSADAGFARDMQQHHGQAVDMSLVVRSAGVKSDVMTLAYDIATTQENQRGEMRGWLQSWDLPLARSEDAMAWMTRSGHSHRDGGPMLLPDGRMRGMADDSQLGKLRSSRGRSAEVLYLQLMIPHHIAGVDMAKACVSACSQPEVVSSAQKMVNGQKSEISLMTSMLRKRGATVPKT